MSILSGPSVVDEIIDARVGRPARDRAARGVAGTVAARCWAWTSSETPAIAADGRATSIYGELPDVGFLRSYPELEHWLCSAAADVRALTDQEYRRLAERWRERFEHALAMGDYVSGSRATDGMLNLLPSDVFVFSLPGYRLLPSGTDPTQIAYGYEVQALATVDFDIANPADAIFSDRAFTFACLCTHEAGAFAEAQLAPADAARRGRTVRGPGP
jgi:hypothetical protein